MSHLCHSLGKFKRPQVRLPVELPHITRQSFKTQDYEDNDFMGDGFMDQNLNNTLTSKIWHFTNIKSLPGTIPGTLPGTMFTCSKLIPKAPPPNAPPRHLPRCFQPLRPRLLLENYGSIVAQSSKKKVFLPKETTAFFQFVLNSATQFNPVQPSSTNKTTLGNHRFSVVGSCLLGSSNGIQGLPPGVGNPMEIPIGKKMKKE